MNIVRKIEIEQHYLHTLYEQIPFYKKEIHKTKAYNLGIMKINCNCLIATIDEILKTKNKLNKLYYKQNKTKGE